MPQETLLVTGAAGSVGSTARVAIGILLEQGRRVRALVRKLDGAARHSNAARVQASGTDAFYRT